MTDTPTPKREEAEREAERLGDALCERQANGNYQQNDREAFAMGVHALFLALARQTAAIESVGEKIESIRGLLAIQPFNPRMQFCGVSVDCGDGKGFVCCLPPGHEGGHA